MDDILDRLWEVIAAGLEALALGMDRFISPLETLGPSGVIFILALLTAGFTRIMTRLYRTRRLDALKKEFLHWQSVREEAMGNADREKGKAMAKNIDQAKLNKVYYDYFFEGLLKNLVTTVLPILVMVAYLSRLYTPQRLMERFGDKWIFTLPAGDPIHIGTLFWYIICLFISFGLIAGLRSGARILRKGSSH